MAESWAGSRAGGTARLSLVEGEFISQGNGVCVCVLSVLLCVLPWH